ncbi:hypothetical protein HN51_047390 [Arachis hypogaea]
MPNSNAKFFISGFPMQEIKPSLEFSLVDGLGSNGGQVENNDNHNNGRLLFSFGEIKHHHHHQLSAVVISYWC